MHKQSDEGDTMRIGKMGLVGNMLGAAMLTCGLANLPAQTTDAITVAGTVKDASNQAAIAGAMVSLLSDPTLSAITDANGAFTITIAPTVGIGARENSGTPMDFRGSDLSFSIGAAGAHVSLHLYDFRGRPMRTLLDRRFPQGEYKVSAAPAGLPAGLYLVRARVGSRSAAYKMSILGDGPVLGEVRSGLVVKRMESPAARLAKAAAGGVDFLVVTKAGYLKRNHEVMVYADAQNVLLTANVPAVAALKIFSDSNIASAIDWPNAAIYSWEQTTTLATDSTGIGFHGSIASMKVTPVEFSTWNGWAFHVAALANGTQPTADLTPYANGSLHLAVRGTAASIGVMISSKNQGKGTAPLVDLATKGYAADSAWHEITIPMSEFAGTLDLSDVFVYCGFVSPAVQGGTFDPLSWYYIDDVYFLPPM